jgi:D-alanine-D-alanine ligase
MYPKLWEAEGLAYSNLIDKLLQLAIERYQRNAQLKTDNQ